MLPIPLLSCPFLKTFFVGIPYLFWVLAPESVVQISSYIYVSSLYFCYGIWFQLNIVKYTQILSCVVTITLEAISFK